MSERAIPRFPHCDPRVLHAPGECVYCDAHPSWQALRKTWGVRFTGHTDGGELPCPADLARGLAGAHSWPGNRPHPLGATEPEDSKF